MGAPKEVPRMSALPQVYVCEQIAGWRPSGCGLPSPIPLRVQMNRYIYLTNYVITLTTDSAQLLQFNLALAS